MIRISRVFFTDPSEQIAVILIAGKIALKSDDLIPAETNSRKHHRNSNGFNIVIMGIVSGLMETIMVSVDRCW